ncbi:MAG: class I SAM-dependent methyltransferase [Chromatiaceae bacterium]
MVDLFDFNPPQPAGAPLPVARIEDFLARYPLPQEIGRGWHTLNPYYAKTLLALLYDASAETGALKQLFATRILQKLAHLGHALDIGSGKGRLLEMFRAFERITLVERDAASLVDLRQTLEDLHLPAEILERDYDQVPIERLTSDLTSFTHSIYYFHEDWGELARRAFSSLRPGGSLVFTLNGDEGAAALMVDDLSRLGISGLSKLDIAGFVAACAGIEGARVSVYRLPCRIHPQHHPEFMVHMARIFLEDLCVSIPTDIVRSYLVTQNYQLGFVDKVIEIRRKASGTAKSKVRGGIR